MDVMQVPGADTRQVNWVDGRHILKPDSALVRAALDLLATHVADAAAGTSPRCGQCGRYFPCPTVENARQVVVAGGGLLTVAGKRDRKGSAAAVRTAVGDPVAPETAVAPVNPVKQKATGGTRAPESGPALAAVSGGPRKPAVVEVTADGSESVETAVAGSEAAEAFTGGVATEGAAKEGAAPVEAPADGPASTVAAGMIVTVTQIPAPLVPGLPGPRVPHTAAGHRKGRATGAGEQVVAADPVGAA